MDSVGLLYIIKDSEIPDIGISQPGTLNKYKFSINYYADMEKYITKCNIFSCNNPNIKNEIG